MTNKTKVTCMQDYRKEITRLSELPQLSPANDLWNQIEKKAKQQQKNRRWSQYAKQFTELAMVASLLLMVIVKVPTVLHQQQIQNDQLEQIKHYSSLLDTAWLNEQANSQVQTAQKAYLSARIHDQIAAVDNQLNQNPKSRQLWLTRVGLMENLIQLYQPPTTRYITLL
ncbi:MAG: hypothetical protein ACWA5R_02180 [bacterium]